jgi:UDP-glucose 4-epimerase
LTKSAALIDKPQNFKILKFYEIAFFDRSFGFGDRESHFFENIELFHIYSIEIEAEKVTILLTGGAGYIGSHTAVSLITAGADVVLCDNFSNSSRLVVEAIETIVSRRIPLVECDVRDTYSLTEVLNRYNIKAVIHFAGLKAVGESVTNPIDYYANNVQGSVSLLQAMRSSGTRRIVFSSSATVYGNPKYLPFDEDHPTEAINPYGRTKLHIEEMLRDVAKSDQSWRIVCLRYFNPVGAHPTGLIGENPLGVPNNLMPHIAQVAIGQKKEVSIFGVDYSTPDGSGIRDYVHVLDLADGHVAALNYLDQQSGFHVFNLGTGNGTSVLQLIKKYEEICGNKIPYKIVERRSGDLAESYADTRRAALQLGWKATRALSEMCESNWKYQKSKQGN